ncbi:hypothetical protein FE257_007138 [Aspergillus nanangensis]|uniref:Acyl carrier protein n=1 Tax=Aspergillus nanangensis TaxID=2582783 RepID=A0AAD4GUG5_ASPNN|nr:hypothetical protein FE257_007138 [Aspergillus nanangensis]
MSDIDGKVKAIVAEQLGVETGEVKNTSSFVNDLGADSLDTVELIMALEEAFDIEIPDEQAEQMTTGKSPPNSVPEEKGGIRRILTDETPSQTERFARRIFSPSERDDFHLRYRKVLQLRGDLQAGETETYERALWRLSSWVAGRFAAKEAAMKAVSPRRLKWHQAEVIIPGRDMKPLLVIHHVQSVPPLVEKHAAQLSISHDGEYAIATVLATTTPGDFFSHHHGS